MLPAAARGARALIAWASTLARRDCFRPPLGAAVAFQDFAEAAKWLKLAADQGYPLAQYELGLIYRTGHGVTIDQVQSYVWLNLAAAAGIQQAVAAREEVMRSLNGKQLAQAQKTSRDWLVSKSKTKTTDNGASKPSSDGVVP